MRIDPRFRSVLLAGCLAVFAFADRAAAEDRGSLDRILSIFDVSPRVVREDPPCSLCAILNRQLSQGGSCTSGAEAPFADLYYLRHPGEVVFSAPVMGAFARATASQSPNASATYLAPYLEDPDADLRYAAAIVILMTHIQAGDGLTAPQARTALEVMDAALAAGISIPGSDAAFVRAWEAREAGRLFEARAAIRDATALEPRYFAALALDLELAIDRTVRVGHQSNALCAASYGDMLTALAAIVDLSPCRYQAAHLDLYLARRFSVPDDMPAINVARVYLALIAGRHAAARAARERVADASGLACKPTLLAELDDLVQTSEALE